MKMKNHISVDYDCDHGAIPIFQKEKPEDITYKKICFKHLADALCSQLDFNSHLDVGCGSGYLLLSMRELGKTSFGAEVGYMYRHGLFPEIKNFVFETSIFELDSIDMKFDMVSAMEVLEHIYAENFYKSDLNDAITNLINLSKRYVFLTMPILTYEYCPWLDWKGRDPRFWPRILKSEEIPLNEDKTPILGHVTLATEGWWTCKLESFGLRRMKESEENINLYLHGMEPGLLDWWHIFLYEK